MQWLVADDNVKPELHRDLPEWMTCRVSHIWMVKSEAYHPWEWIAPEPTASGTALDEVLALLRKTN